MRRRILLLVTAITVLVVLAFAIPVAILTRSAVAQRADDRTTGLAQSAASYLHNINGRSAAQIRAYFATVPLNGRSISITLPSGLVVGSTPADGQAGPFPGGGFGGFRGRTSSTFPSGGATSFPSGGATGGGATGGGFTDGDGNRAGVPSAKLQSAPGGQVAVLGAQSATGEPYVVRVYLSDGIRYNGVGTWYWLLAGGSVALLLIGIGAGELLTRRITRPLLRTAETAQQLSVGDVTARAPTDGPREIADVGKALNRLAARIDELIAEERETVADLSHRLRTPLTALRLDAESLRDDTESDRVAAHVGELERMLTAVIRAARRPQREGRMPSCDATAVVGERVEFWSALTEEQGRHSSVSLPADALPVRAAAEDLAAAVDALLENVVAHTDEGVDFGVELSATESGARLEISDAGGGVPEAAEERGRSDRGSTGLGLDIARRCAEASGGSMRIGQSVAGGALVTLNLRAP